MGSVRICHTVACARSDETTCAREGGIGCGCGCGLECGEMLLLCIGGGLGFETRCCTIAIRRIEITARLQRLELVRGGPRALLVARHCIFERMPRARPALTLAIAEAQVPAGLTCRPSCIRIDDDREIRLREVQVAVFVLDRAGQQQ